MKDSIGVIGSSGYVGKAMVKLFEKHYDVHPCDKASSNFENELEAVNAHCRLGVVCVPTPRGDDGSCDTSAVEEVVACLRTPLILIKSTVEVGTVDRLTEKYGKRIVFSPEYCGESSYWTPYKFHKEVVETPFFVFGGSKKDTSELVDIFMPVVGPTKRFIQTDAKTAELAKYLENSFYATKVTFCYEAAEICKAVGADWNEVREVWLADPRINPMHTAVFEGNDYPFAGRCLPKDISAFAALAKKAGYNAELLSEVMKTNERIAKRRKERRERGAK